MADYMGDYTHAPLVTCTAGVKEHYLWEELEHMAAAFLSSLGSNTNKYPMPLANTKTPVWVRFRVSPAAVMPHPLRVAAWIQDGGRTVVGFKLEQEIQKRR
jgi:hypothetical protein